jgi:hypothetical protein
MAIGNLNDFAKALRDYRESQWKAGFARSDEELKLINNLLLQAVREIIVLERRVAALEGKTSATRISTPRTHRSDSPIAPK